MSESSEDAAPARAISYPDAAAYYARREFGGRVPLESAMDLASVLIDAGAVAGAVAYEAGQNGGVPPQKWVPLDPTSEWDRRILAALDSAAGGDATIPVPEAFETRPGGSVEVDVNRAPLWLAPRTFVDGLASSRESAQAGVTALTHAVLSGNLDPAALEADGGRRVHARWVAGALDSRWADRHALMIPFLQLARAEQIKDLPYATGPAASLNRIFGQIARNARSGLQIPVDGHPDAHLEEELAAAEVYSDLVRTIARMGHVIYRAHWAARGETRMRELGPQDDLDAFMRYRSFEPRRGFPPSKAHGPQVDIVDCDFDELPWQFKELGLVAAQQLVEAITSSMVRGDVPRVTSRDLLEGYLATYVAHQRTLPQAQSRLTAEQAAGIDALPPDELLLNGRLIEGALMVFDALFTAVEQCSAERTPACLVDPLGAVPNDTAVLPAPPAADAGALLAGGGPGGVTGMAPSGPGAQPAPAPGRPATVPDTVSALSQLAWAVDSLARVRASPFSAPVRLVNSRALLGRLFAVDATRATTGESNGVRITAALNALVQTREVTVDQAVTIRDCLLRIDARQIGYDLGHHGRSMYRFGITPDTSLGAERTRTRDALVALESVARRCNLAVQAAALS